MNNQSENTSKLISIVVPCYNEQDSIGGFVERISPVLEQLDLEYELLFVDDGSNDDTLALLSMLSEKFSAIRVVALTRNFGKEAALTAALDHARGDAVIPMDSDLQDPVELIPQMVRRWRAGAEVVLARRIERSSDSRRRRLLTWGYYRLLSRLSSPPMPRDVGDYRLMDATVVRAVRQLRERNRFMKGIMSWPGYRVEVVDFVRPERREGHSKWRSWRLFNFALDGLFSFSTAPLRMWTYAGLLLSAFSLMYLVYIVMKTLVFGVDLPGYASIVSIILFFSGINLVGLGILGEYLGRVFVEVKQRPIYLVRHKIGFDQDQN